MQSTSDQEEKEDALLDMMTLKQKIDSMRQRIRKHDTSAFRKSSAESDRLKILGNQALKGNRLQHALQLYNEVRECTREEEERHGFWIAFLLAEHFSSRFPSFANSIESLCPTQCRPSLALHHE